MVRELNLQQNLCNISHHTSYALLHYLVQEAQLMLTNLRDAFRGQSKSPNMVQFDMLGMFSY